MVGKRAIFDRVGGEFVQRKRQRQGRLRLQDQFRSVDTESAGARLAAIGGDRLVDYLAHIGAFPMLARQHVMGL